MSSAAATSSNPHERAARLKKAIALAQVIRQAGGDAASAEALSDAGWQVAADAAGVKMPSAATRQAAVAILAGGSVQ